jgi:hypothetical protein
MTKEEFIKVLDREEYPYEIVGNKIIVNAEVGTPGYSGDGFLYLGDLKSLPPNVHFKVSGNIHLDALTHLPSGISFGGRGWMVKLDSLRSIPSDTRFEINASIRSLIGPAGGYGYFHAWEGLIEGIAPKRLLDKMVSLGLFNKEKK